MAPSATLGIVGMGYVGRPLAELFRTKGGVVLGFDVDPARAEAGWERLSECEAVILCVPTPLNAQQQPDLTHVVDATQRVAEHLRPGQLVVLESTTWPGTTRQVVGPILRGTGQPFLLAYSPERIDPGRDADLGRVPKLVGGIDAASLDAAAALYGRVFERVVRMSSCEAAEATKLLENVYRAVNIALVNEFKQTALAMGLDVWEIIDAAATKPYGFEPFYPGPGMGGHCIPIDPFYLAWAAKRIGAPHGFIELAGAVNRGMPGYVVKRTREALGTLAGKRLVVLGLAYKPNISDVRESPAVALLEQLEAQGALAVYHDPHVPTHGSRRSTDDLSGDAAIIATAHAAIDWDRVARSFPVIVDTRGVMRGRATSATVVWA